jgi:CheY-like chemotaxis protein
MMDGIISVKSEYGKGSEFTIMVPQKIVDKTPLGAPTARNLESFQFINLKRERRKRPRLQLPYAKALVVDDVETNLDVAKGMLLPYNMEIDCVSSGPDAIRLIREEKKQYDVIFMDHMMPEMDGIEAVRVIRTDINTDYARSVPVIALTANALVGNDTLFLDNGFQAFLSKPIDTAKLDTLLNTWVRNKEKESKMLESNAAKFQQAAEQPPSAAEASEVPAEIFSKQVEGIDFTEGLQRFSNIEKVYLKILKSFVANMPKHIEKIRTLADFDSMNADSLSAYTVTVHGIKGSCYGVAAQVAGKQAEELEMAAKRGDLQFLKNNNAVLAQAIDKLLADLQGLLG